MKRYMFAVLMVLLATGCGGPEEATAPSPSPEPPTVSEATPATPAADPAPQPAEPVAQPAPPTGFVSASVQVVDLAGQPLMGMAPIVTRQPNAFDQPVAMGDPTDAKGQGTIRFENNEHLYLRAWDPLLGYFPNNFYEVLPGGSMVTETLTIQMVPSAGLEAQLILPDGQPAANQAVEIMLSHATRGPWWPARGQADAEGVVRFRNLPAGEFLLEFRVQAGAALQVTETPLPPGEVVNLGALNLQ